MRRYLTLFIFLMCLGYFYPQQVINVDFTVKDNFMEVTYDLVGCKPEQLSDVKLTAIYNGKPIYPSSVSGDLKMLACGTQKKISWNVLQDKYELKGGVKVIVTISKTYSIRSVIDDTLLNSMTDKSTAEKLNIVEKSIEKIKEIENQDEYYKLLNEINYSSVDSQLTIFKKCIVLEPNNYVAYRERARFKYFQLADYTAALIDINKALSLNSDDGYCYYMRAMIKEKMGDSNGMCADYKKAWEFASQKKNTTEYEFYEELYNKKCGK